MTITTILIIGAVIILPIAFLAIWCAKREDDQMRELREHIAELYERLEEKEEKEK